MYLKRIGFFTMIILIVSGCTDYFMICSLHPFYTDKNVILLPEIEGIWTAAPLHPLTEQGNKENNDVWNQADTISKWKIERFFSKSTSKNKKGGDSIVIHPANFYEVKLISNLPDSSKYEFRMVLFRINKVVYADFMPAGNSGLSQSRLASESYLSVHTLARVTIDNGQADISWLSAEYMKQMIEKKHVRVNYRWVESAKRLLLTGTSEQLTRMIERYAGETRFIDWKNQQAMLKLTLINQ